MQIMDSPAYPDTPLMHKELEPGLSVYECPSSGGVWIPLQSFLDWRERRGEQAVSLPKGYAPVFADDSGNPALICPESGRLLIRYRVGHGLGFHVDRSPATGGVWLDRGEWDALKSHGLHRELHLVFTASYQRRIRSASYNDRLEQTFAARIGAPDLERVLQFKDWLLAHPRRRDIWCYLTLFVEDISDERDSPQPRQKSE